MADIIVTETLSGAVFTDAKGDSITLSGTWTTDYNPTSGAVVNGPHPNGTGDVVAHLTATGALGTTTFTSLYAPYSTPMSDQHQVKDGYELTANGASNSLYSSLYIDYTTEHPAGLAAHLDTGFMSSIRDANGNLYTLTAAGSTTTAACFLAGTRLAVPGGSRAVEEIGIGDQVLLASGAAAAVKWVGWHSHHRRFAANNPELLPVRITAGALAHGGRRATSSSRPTTPCSCPRPAACSSTPASWSTAAASRGWRPTKRRRSSATSMSSWRATA